MAKVAFVSHASEDAAIAASITDYLERNGVTCWIAPRDVTPGGDYGAEIVHGIETSAVFVLVLSEHANESRFVKREVERAVSKGKPIFPIRVREVLPSRSLELFISSAHWIDAWQPPIEKYLARLAESITAAAKVYGPRPAGPATALPAVPAAAKSRRHLMAASAIALLLLAGGGWYAYRLLGTTVLPRSTPSWDISGQDWRCCQNCQSGLAGRHTPITQSGRDFIFTNEAGITSDGIYDSGYKIRVTGWNLSAIVAPSLKQIKFSNGTVWARSVEQGAKLGEPGTVSGKCGP